MAQRWRAAIARVWSTDDAEALAPLDPVQIFDFASGVRLVVTIEQVEETHETPAGLVLTIVASSAPGGRHPPITRDAAPAIVWLYKQLNIDAQQKMLHIYSAEGRVVMVLEAPPGAGEPVPVPELIDEPTQPAAIAEGPDGVFQRPRREVFDIEIPPGLVAGIPGFKATAVKRDFTKPAPPAAPPPP